MIELKFTAEVNTNNSYNIFIQTNLLNNISILLKNQEITNRYAIITDSKVEKIYANKLKNLLSKHDCKATIFSFPKGEKSKSLKTVEKLSKQLLEEGFNRSHAIIALGGGVVGDIAGFLASIYMRGIPYVNIPTTLLAMLDSSIGGKTGVNLNLGKNLLGSFYNPKAVLIDPYLLNTLPKNQIKNGLVEAIKIAIVNDKKLFNFIEKNIQSILDLDEEVIKALISTAIQNKIQIVEKDQYDKGLRQLLNYGHTYGHFFEKKSSYQLLHGYAVSIGMVLENRLATKAKILDKNSATRIKNLLKSIDLPISTMNKPKLEDLKYDKKMSGNFINFALPTKIGKAKIHKVEINS